ncbi:hypothetical protein LJR269_006532 [Duganella sp. LjRoot269]
MSGAGGARPAARLCLGHALGGASASGVLAAPTWLQPSTMRWN